MDQLPQALQALARYRQFIAYKLVPRGDNLAKMPHDPNTGRPMPKGEDWQNRPEYLADFETAAATARAIGGGVGFLFTEADPFWFLDIDHALQTVLDPATGAEVRQWSALASSLCQRLAGAAVEVSQSGTGLHIIGTASSLPVHGCRNQREGIELYHTGRFVALTGLQAVGDARADLTTAIAAVVAEYFPAASLGPGPAGTEWRDTPLDGYGGPDDDDELIALMLKSGNPAREIFGGKAPFRALWEGDPLALARAFPDPTGNNAYGASEADMALASRLAFWTGGNHERVERLMWRSGLVRDKWSDPGHRTYLRELTITRAVAGCDQIYTGKAKPNAADVPPPPEPGPTPREPLRREVEVATGYQLLTAFEQPNHFNGCVYIQDQHRVFTPSGAVLKPDQFRATYGGYSFAMDASGEATSKSAWEAFTESRAVRYPKAASSVFRPDLAPGELVEEEGRLLVNTYTPARVRKVKGDAGPFLRHLAIVLPNPIDQAILLAYMAACVQYIGVKFQWWPLVQGAEGNGKTLFSRCVAYAVGLQYSHFPKASEIDSKFNGWLLRKLFIGVEDVYYPDGKEMVWESLKPIITNDRLPIELKGVDQMTAYICANGILNSNHKDALRKTANDRRVAPFFCAQQSAEDIERDGMGVDYFPRLYAWLKGDGYAIVADYLSTYQIPDDYNPARVSHRAPVTSSTEEAIELSAGPVEQEVLEAIAARRPGFVGAWVSSHALDELLKHTGFKVQRRKRRDIMRAIGYDWHPALPDGRMTRTSEIDGFAKPRLYVRRGTPEYYITTPGEVAEAYTAAQRGTTTDEG